MAPHQEEHVSYHPRDAIAFATESAMLTGGFGALFAGIQNTIARQNVGAMGFFTRFGSTTAVFSIPAHSILTYSARHANRP
jgi:hypothetical protein